jgi:Chondroitinase B
MVKEFEGDSDKELDLGKTQKERVILKNCTNCTIKNTTFEDCGSGDWLIMEDCVDCKILHCDFETRNNTGNYIHLKGEKTRDNLIEDCRFKNHTGDGEAIIVGCNEWSGCNYKTTIRNCKFIGCTGDDEIVSIKSFGNVFEDNEIRDGCDGNIVIRHGGRNKILINRFIGDVGGIRVFGANNQIIGNHHRDNNNENDNRRPLIIECGDFENDPNTGDCPGDGHGRYARPKENKIKDNIYEKCKGVCVVWGFRFGQDDPERSFKPKDNEFKENKLKAGSEHSVFLEFKNGVGEDDNDFKDNEMEGSGAERGDLPQSGLKD